MSIPEQVPAELIAGDTWRWTRSYADYPAPTWDLTFYAENKDGQFSQASVDSGSDHAFTIPAATSAGLKPGRYRWHIRATDGVIVETIEGPSTLTVLPDPAAAGTHDTRSWARKTLDELEALLQRFATTAQQSGSVGGRSYSRADLSMLTQWRTDLRQEVRTEEQGARAGRGRDIKVRFGRA